MGPDLRSIRKTAIVSSNRHVGDFDEIRDEERMAWGVYASAIPASNGRRR